MDKLTIEISKEEHRKIKTLAAFNGQTIKDFVMSKIFEEDVIEDSRWQEFENLLQERVFDAKNNKASQKSIMDILKEELSSQKLTL